ncbi:MAG TPA: mannose-6-phosphate isomerase, class I [Labilithrix sp.]
MDLLDCRVMPYAWGSRTAIAELQGRKTPTGPEAEMWMGAHPVAPSRLTRGAETKTLAEIVEADPERELGARVTAEFGARLPFLLKVLAAAEPLSLQAHPTAEQARAGFADEERRGIPRDAPTRNYRDASHKPELVCPLTRFEALCGFRRVSETLALFDALDVKALEGALAPLRKSPDAHGLAATFRLIMTTPPHARDALVSAVLEACARVGTKDAQVATRLGTLYPGDVGVVSALLLNHLVLEPGEAIYLGAGNLHAYLEGVAVEVMAASDNVLRGGLTKKHVDVAELLAVLDFHDGPVEPLRARALDPFESVYDTSAREFRLSRLQAPGARLQVSGPEILLCTEGSVKIDTLELARGQAAFVPASTRSYAIEGQGVLYRATPNLV